MSLLFETIRVHDGKFQNIEFHNYRLNKSRKELFDISDSINLEKVVQIPSRFSKGIFRCRVIYNASVKEYAFESYFPRKIESLRLVEDNTITYKYKYTDRSQLDELFAKRGSSDDILIVKDGVITDTSFSNIIFFTGKQWITPNTPLLHGTMRCYLLKKNLVSETEIIVSDLMSFQKARLINAMLPFESAIDIEVAKIGY